MHESTETPLGEAWPCCRRRWSGYPWRSFCGWVGVSPIVVSMPPAPASARPPAGSTWHRSGCRRHRKRRRRRSANTSGLLSGCRSRKRRPGADGTGRDGAHAAAGTEDGSRLAGEQRVVRLARCPSRGRSSGPGRWVVVLRAGQHQGIGRRHLGQQFVDSSRLGAQVGVVEGTSERSAIAIDTPSGNSAIAARSRPALVDWRRRLPQIPSNFSSRMLFSWSMTHVPESLPVSTNCSAAAARKQRRSGKRNRATPRNTAALSSAKLTPATRPSPRQPRHAGAPASG